MSTRAKFFTTLFIFSKHFLEGCILKMDFLSNFFRKFFVIFLICSLVGNQSDPACAILPLTESERPVVSALLSLYKDSKRYDEVAWLTAHNAFSSFDSGWKYAQQKLDLDGQYRIGVRAFMLDLHYYQGQVALCHEERKVEEDLDMECPLTAKVFKRSTPEYLKSVLEQVKRWLDFDKSSVVTLIFESYLGKEGHHHLKSLFSLTRLSDNILSPDMSGDSILWPTLREMRSTGRRLVIISDNEGDRYIHTKFLRETNYNLRDYHHCEMRGDQRDTLNKTSLFIFNHFYPTSFTAEGVAPCDTNNYDSIVPRLEMCKQQEGRYPNFVAVDFVDQGSALDAVFALNTEVRKISLSSAPSSPVEVSGKTDPSYSFWDFISQPTASLVGLISLLSVEYMSCRS